MAAGKYSFVIEQGSTFDIEIQYKDSNGDPIDLTGYQARMHIRQTTDSNTILLALSSSRNPDGTGLNMSGSAGINPPVSGTIGIYISACTSSTLTFNEAKYDLEIYSGSSCPYVIRILQGTVKLSKEVTR